jgi:hypothetical protein
VQGVACQQDQLLDLALEAQDLIPPAQNFGGEILTGRSLCRVSSKITNPVEGLDCSLSLRDEVGEAEGSGSHLPCHLDKLIGFW